MRTLRLSLTGTVIVALLAGLSGAVLAQDGEAETGERETILFVGNSFTFFNDGVETHVQALAGSEDPTRAIEVDSAAFGGATLATHYQMEHLASGARKRIASGEFDTVVLQGDIPEIPDRTIDPFLEHARLLHQEVADAGGDTVFFMTWPYERLGWVGLDEIEAAHRQIQAETGAAVAPVGGAMSKALAERPDLAMLGPDAEHESLAGTYLAATTIYATLFDQSPEGLPYHPENLTEEDASFLQRIAWETVQEWQADLQVAE
jgi:hypothetical protein